MKKEQKKVLKEIDKNIRKSFGKFYVFSIIMIICLLLFPLIMGKVKVWFGILLLLFFVCFYIYMILDLYKKRSNYWTILTSILIFAFIMIMTLDVIKLVFFLIK